MSELIVIGYDEPEKAQQARQALFRMSKEYLVDVADAVVATPDENGKIKLDQMVNLWTAGATGGAFWGVLIGLLFLNPLLGAAAGAATGGLAGALSDYGIKDDFMKDVSSVLQPGQAALFIMARRATSDRVIERLSAEGGRILRTNLDRSKEQEVRDAFERAREQVSEDDALAKISDTAANPKPGASGATVNQ